MPRPIHVLELRSVRGTGGGPEKTILLGAASADPARVRITVCYIRDSRDRVFALDHRANELGVDYVEVTERHSFDLSAWSALRRLVRERGIDIVHAHEYKTDLIAAFLARTEGIVPLATAHGWTGNSARERFFYYPADRRLLATFPRVIAVSGEIRRTLLRAGARPGRVTTVLNGIDPEAFRRNRMLQRNVRRSLGIDALDVVVGSIGRLERQKRFDLLIDAVARVRESRPRVRLLVAGDGSLRSDLEAHARKRLPQTAYMFLGHRTDVRCLHHAIDVYAQSSDYEGTPNAVLEAMALETPVVATDAGGTAELLVDGAHGRIVVPGDVAALAGAIARAIDERKETARLAAAARERVEETLSFDARMQAVERIYEELMEGRSGWTRSAAAGAVTLRGTA